MGNTITSLHTNKNLVDYFPNLVKEWHPIKNNGIILSSVTIGSNKKVWWICQNGHEYEATIYNRVAKRNGCAQCSGKKVSDTNNILYRDPALAKQWHPTKNGNLTPDQVVYGSHKKVWWKCSQGHEWEVRVNDRINYKTGCPFCSGKRVSNSNNLAVLLPSIVEQWHPTKNGDLTPQDVLRASNKMIWWQCNKGHEWKTRVYQRTSIAESACPLCCWNHTEPEKDIEKKLNIPKYNKRPLTLSTYRPDFKLSEDLYLNVDGLYWHSEVCKEKDYHYKMREAYEKEGKRILQFYEDEVYNKWDIVQSIINNALGKTGNKIGARKCVIKKVSEEEASEFYNANHLMGSCIASKHIALIYNYNLVSLLSYRVRDNSITIERFCNLVDTNVVGAFQKLLHWVLNLEQLSLVISFCDLRYATGKSYEKAGFKLEGVSQGWCWTDKFKRFNRLYCKATSDKSEQEHAIELGLIKIYDAGQDKYVLEV